MSIKGKKLFIKDKLLIVIYKMALKQKPPLKYEDKPLHSNRIWKQISKQRGFPRYAIEQKLHKEPQFIKTAPSTYTVKENISAYEQKYRIVVNFAKEWINIKGHAVSAFFVNEVLKTTEEVKDLTIGLVDHN